MNKEEELVKLKDMKYHAYDSGEPTGEAAQDCFDAALRQLDCEIEDLEDSIKNSQTEK